MSEVPCIQVSVGGVRLVAHRLQPPLRSAPSAKVASPLSKVVSPRLSKYGTHKTVTTRACSLSASYTLHPTPYTLHPTPYTLPYTLHPTPYTLHPAPYTLHPTLYTLHPKPTCSVDVRVRGRANMAHIRKPRPDYGLDFPVKVRTTL